MGDVRLGGVASLPPPPDVPPFPYIAFEGSSQNAIWMMGDLQTPKRVPATQNVSLSSPMYSPSRYEIVYGVQAFSGDVLIQTVDLSDLFTANTIVTHSSPPFAYDPMPYWTPDGNQIVYRKITGSSAFTTEIRIMDRDGSNDTLLHTFTGGAFAFAAQLSCPVVSPSGLYIAFGKSIGTGDQNEVWVMEIDGSNPTKIATVGETNGGSSGLQWSTPYNFMSWMWGQDTLGWMEMQAGTGDSSVFRRMDFDGSNDAVLLDDPHNGSSPNTKWVGTSRFAWLPDDSAIVSARIGGGGKYEIATVDASGGGAAALGSNEMLFTVASNAYGQTSWEYSPVVFPSSNGFADGRVYFTKGATSGGLINYDVFSCLADGSDQRTDDDGTVSPAHGYWVFNGIGD